MTFGFVFFSKIAENLDLCRDAVHLGLQQAPHRARTSVLRRGEQGRHAAVRRRGRVGGGLQKQLLGPTAATRSDTLRGEEAEKEEIKERGNRENKGIGKKNDTLLGRVL